MSEDIRAVLFDLDGTLIDSAPDLAGVGNDMRMARGLAPLPFERFRPMVGTGARGMINLALNIGPGHESFAALRDEFFQRYEDRMWRETRVFDAMQPVLVALQAKGMPWGIVTNKIKRFTQPLVQALGLHTSAACVISGDTTAHSKPHPAPLLEAARQLGHKPENCIYVGDDLRDVQAGRAAGMQTAVAAWGYLGEGDHFSDWGADHVIHAPNELLNLLGMT